jgi:Antirestriction protein
MKPETITASAVPENHRMAFLPHMFGARRMIPGETMLYHFAGKLSPDYKGGFWNFYRLSEGGYFAAPAAPARLLISVPGNGFEREVSAEAAGVIISLFALGAMADRAADRGDEGGTDLMTGRYHQLLNFARSHAERAAIMAAID